MKGQHFALFAVLTIVALLPLSGCNNKDGTALGAAIATHEWFEKNRDPGSVADKIWGFHLKMIYGFDCPDFLFGPKVKMETANPLVYSSSASCWLEAVTTDGNHLKIQRDVKLVLTYHPDSVRWVVTPHFSNDRPLTFWPQVGEWLLWAFLGPIIIFVAVVIFILVDQDGETEFLLAPFFAGILTPSWIGYVSYLAFGSTLSIFIGILVSLVVVGVAIIMFLKATMASPFKVISTYCKI